jgi:NAD(P)-dependent dehydrogenase (short-subunit alcohol dehydrogenase family)
MKLCSLEGRRILITGASSGIGRACAICAAEAGATLILTGRRVEALEETLSLCKPGSHLVFAGDIANQEFVSGLVEKAGKIDGLVHSAGVAPMCPVNMLTREQMDEVMRVNYYAFLELMKYYSRSKYRNNSLSAVVISSVSAECGWAGGSIYCGSKGALCASVRALALELAGKNIRVNAVSPSNIKTPLYESGAEDVNTEESLKRLMENQPLGLGTPEQVALPVCFLLSDAASFITGVDLPVDGGYLAH